MADQNNPWDTTPAADSAAQSADAWGTPTTAPTDGGGADWLTSTPAPNVEHFNILDPFHKTLIPFFCIRHNLFSFAHYHPYSIISQFSLKINTLRCIFPLQLFFLGIFWRNFSYFCLTVVKKRL